MILVGVLHTSGHHAPEENWAGFEFCLNDPSQGKALNTASAFRHSWFGVQDNPNLMWSKQL